MHLAVLGRLSNTGVVIMHPAVLGRLKTLSVYVRKDTPLEF
jgi:hypothetical protein